MGSDYTATIGGRGCGASGSHNVACRYNGFVDGQAEVQCFGRASVVSGEGGGRERP